MDEIKLDDGIQIDMNQPEIIKPENHVIDWLGRKRTIKEIKERNDCRYTFLLTVLGCIYAISLITFPILAVAYQKNQPVFIASLVMTSILGAPLISGLIGCLISLICQCCCKML